MENGISAQLRSVISLVDRLRDINLEAYIQLPKIVVVGGQSSGKSSLIEQIVGLDFLPRGTGVVTRRPLEIRMIYEPTLNESYALFEQLPGKKMTDFKKVKEAIEQLTDKVCGKNKNIIDKAIILYVHSKNCPNLTVIDLPGLTRIAIEGQSEDIYRVTTQMIRKYMMDPTSIILCVIPANQDITNDQVLHMAMQIDLLGERTIGCITKIDIMDRGTDARSLLLNKGQVPLKLGYIGIKNRSQGDIQQNKSVTDSIAAQKMFFSTSPIYSSLPASCLGTGALITSLTKVLQSNILQFLPELMAQIKQKKAILHQIVKQYGKPLPKNQQEEQALLWSICNQFLTEFRKTLRGHISSLKCREILSKNSTHIIDKFAELLQDELNTPLAEGLTNKKIYFSIIKYEGNNMPGFPSINSFYYLIDPLLKKLKAPLLHCLTEVCDIVIHVSEQIMQELAREYPNFRQYILQKITGLLQQSKRRCSEFIENVIESEISYIYINNEEFYDKLKEDIEPSDKTDELISRYPMILQLKKRVNVYYKLTVKNLRDTIPKNIKYFILEKAVKQIQFQLFQACLGDKEKTKQWLKLNDRDMNERQQKEKQYEIIVKAEQFLQTHTGFARVRLGDIKKKREEREKELKLIQEENNKKNSSKNNKLESPIQNEKKAEIPKDSSKKVMNQPVQVNKNQSLQKKTQNETTYANNDKKNSEPQSNPAVQNKNSLFTNLFGLGAAKSPPVAKQPVKEQNLKDKYNQKAGQATDKAVDQMFKNETFKKQTTKAVQNGASLAIQKQTGVSEQTANFFGKGAGWMFKQDATQNYLKDQTKANLKEQVQIKK